MGGCLIFSPQRCLKVIIATAIQHNICIERNIPLANYDDEHDEMDYDDSDDNGGEVVEDTHTCCRCEGQK